MKIDLYLNSKNRHKLMENLYFRNYLHGRIFTVTTDDGIPDDYILMQTIPVNLIFNTVEELNDFLK